MKLVNILFVHIIAFSLFSSISFSQEELTVKMTLEETIELARMQSVESFRVKNMYLARYWEFNSYMASMRPGLSLNSDLFNYSNSLRKRYSIEDNEDYYVPSKGFTNDIGLSVNQAVPWTGGSIYIRSALERTQNLLTGESYFAAGPIWRIGISQPLSGYNDMRWESKIEPLKFEKAKRQYLQDIESISKISVNRFFGLVESQINLEIASNNYANADTLYRIAAGRFEIGTITQDELLDLELSLLNSKISLTKAKMDLKKSQNVLNTFLKMDKNVTIECIVPKQVPSLKINFDQVYSHAMKNNPTLLSYKQQMLEQDKNVSRTKAENGFDGRLNANFGTNGSAPIIPDTYIDPDRSQNVAISFGMPLVDWGRRKGRFLMAKSNREATRLEIEKSLVEFEQDIMVKVMEFNLQEEQVAIAMKADSTAFLGYDITKKRFYIDKVDVIKLNAARNSLASARRSYVNALLSYWTYFFEIRETTLYDFINNQTLEEDFDKLVQEQRF